ncbi:MAG: hypothetical protein V9E82_13230 [Candidatus Nanopelagicales bacterium]
MTRHLVGAIVALFTLLAGTPAAADTQPSVIFLGDSVTAGFGYLGKQENAANVAGSVNSSFANAWYFGDNSLSDCNPVAPVPDDRCSNNNVAGAPWTAGPWQSGSSSPSVAYSYQIAGSQNPQAAAPVENWAVTGSTPAQWDTGGPFNSQLTSIQNTSVVMTLGANPILASFLRIKIAGTVETSGACSGTEWLSWKGWYAYPPATVVDCANQQWAQNEQTAHLQNVYKTLLQNKNKVMVLQYYRGVPVVLRELAAGRQPDQRAGGRQLLPLPTAAGVRVPHMQGRRDHHPVGTGGGRSERDERQHRGRRGRGSAVGGGQRRESGEPADRHAGPERLGRPPGVER